MLVKSVSEWCPHAYRESAGRSQSLCVTWAAPGAAWGRREEERMHDRSKCQAWRLWALGLKCVSPSISSEALGKACVCDDVGCLLEVTPVAGELRACLLTGTQRSGSRVAGRCVCLGFLHCPKCRGDTQQARLAWLEGRPYAVGSRAGDAPSGRGNSLHTLSLCTQECSSSTGDQEKQPSRTSWL